MKVFLQIFFISILLLTGCSSSKIGRQYDFIEPNASVKSDVGYLKIYTINYEQRGQYADDPAYDVYKGYTIFKRNGDYVKDVEKSYRKPELVRLNEGEYIIVAELHKNIINSFTIEIEKGSVLEINKDMIDNPYAMK
jgi:hypothetical protein